MEMLSLNQLIGGNFSPAGVDYPTVLRKRVKKSGTILQPLYEAISNSLEATTGSENHIIITICKNKQLFSDSFSFLSLHIQDDGTGFNESSFSRFERLFDESKNRNNLGSGRLQYLHYFKLTQIVSVFIAKDSTKKKRTILLSMDYYKQYGSVIYSQIEQAGEDTPINTTVSFFIPLCEDDKNQLGIISTSDLKESVLKRYLNNFCINRENLQSIEFRQYINDIYDNSETKTITIDDIPEADYHDEFDINYSTLNIKGTDIEKCSDSEKFTIDAYFLPPSILNKTEIRLTSKGESFPATGFNFSLITEAPRIDKEKNTLFLISSTYLTDSDTDIRGNLELINRKDFLEKRNLFTGQKVILIDDIENSAITSITSKYPVLKRAKEDAQNNLEILIEMFSLDKDVVQASGVNFNDSEINTLKKVYEYKALKKAEGDAKLKRIIDSLDELNPTEHNFQKKLNHRVKELHKLVKPSVRAELLNYLSRRTLVLELLQKALNQQLNCQNTSKKKRNPEAIFHNILFAQHTTNALDSNLWMIDEEYIHFEGVSEGELDKVIFRGEPLFKTNLNAEEKEYKIRMDGTDVGNKRPDVLLFPEEGKCIILEFKAPKVKVDKHLDQITQYATIIHALSSDKYPFHSFYGYLIGENKDIYSIIDKDGDFRYSKALGYVFRNHKRLADPLHRGEASLYMEIIRYSDLLRRAQLRNKIYTDKILNKTNQ